MNLLAVLTALLAILLAVNARPGVLEAQLEYVKDSHGSNDVPAELYSLNSPLSGGVFNGDGFSYNGKNLGTLKTKSSKSVQ